MTHILFVLARQCSRRSLAVCATLALFLVGISPANGQSSKFLNRGVEDWRKDLENKSNASKRRSAAYALGRLGSMAAYAVPDLARCIRGDSDPAVRDMAAYAVGDIVLSLRGAPVGDLWEKTGKDLEVALDHDNQGVRRSAAYALGAFGKTASAAVPSLKKALRDEKNRKSPAVRQNIAWALGRMGPAADAAAIADLCDLLSDRNALVRRDSATALKDLGRTAKRAVLRSACKPLLDMVKGEKDEVARKTALGALATVTGPEHADSAPDLYPLLEDKDPDTARNAAYALANMAGEPAKRALPVLRKALRDSDSSVQDLAAAAISKLGEGAIPAVDDLASVLADSKEPAVRRNCAIALALIGPKAKNAIPALADAMKPGAKSTRANDEVREQSAEAIAKIRWPNNERAMPAVRDRLDSDSNLGVRHRCVWALFNMTEVDLNKYDLVPVLEKLIKDSPETSKSAKYDAARVLAYALRDKAPDKVCDALVEMIKDDGLKVFKKTDAGIDSTPDESKGGSTGFKADLGGDARYMAAEAMAWLGEKAKNNKAIVEALRTASTDKETTLKEAAQKTMNELKIGK